MWTAKKHDWWTMRLNGFQFTYSVYLWLFIIRGKSLFMMIIFFKKSASGSYHLLPATDYAIIVVYYVHVYPQSPWVQSFTAYPFRLSMVSQWSVYWNPILTLTLTNRFVVHLTPVLPSSSYRRPKDMNHKNKYIII